MCIFSCSFVSFGKCQNGRCALCQCMRSVAIYTNRLFISALNKFIASVYTSRWCSTLLFSSFIARREFCCVIFEFRSIGTFFPHANYAFIHLFISFYLSNDFSFMWTLLFNFRFFPLQIIICRTNEMTKKKKKDFHSMNLTAVLATHFVVSKFSIDGIIIHFCIILLVIPTFQFSTATFQLHKKKRQFSAWNRSHHPNRMRLP